MNSLWRHLKHELFDPRHDTLFSLSFPVLVQQLSFISLGSSSDRS